MADEGPQKPLCKVRRITDNKAVVNRYDKGVDLLTRCGKEKTGSFEVVTDWLEVSCSEGVAAYDNFYLTVFGPNIGLPRIRPERMRPTIFDLI
jgi:hypothetical protein